jgi:threonine dehydratase
MVLQVAVSDFPIMDKHNNILVTGTPVRKHDGIYVKHEEACSIGGWPPFSKCRGVLAHIRKRPEKVIGVLDTSHSKAGHAVAYACKLLGKECINFYPLYKADDHHKLRSGQQRSHEFGAKLKPLKAGRSAILYHRARACMEKHGGYLMPNALKLRESVSETALEVHRTKTHKFKYVVIPISSGTIAAGVLKGLAEKKEFPKVIIHLGYTRSKQAVRKYLEQHAPKFPQKRIKIVDEGYAYADVAREGTTPDFPCNRYYDLKCWRWILRMRNKDRLQGRLLFWNIGG